MASGGTSSALWFITQELIKCQQAMMVTWWSGSVRMVNAFRTSHWKPISCPQSALDQKFKALREQSVSAVVGLPRWFNTSLPHWSPSTNFTCKSWIFWCKHSIVDLVYSQVICYKLVWSKKAHSHPIESITYDNVTTVASTSSNQIKVVHLEIMASVVDTSKHGMIITLFSDKLTFLWSHTNTSKTLAIAIHFINPNRWWLCISTAKCKLRCLHRGIFDQLNYWGSKWRLIRGSPTREIFT